MTNEETRVIQAEIDKLNDNELVLRRAVRDRQSREYGLNRKVLRLIEKDIKVIDFEAIRRGLVN